MKVWIGFRSRCYFQHGIAVLLLLALFSSSVWADSCTSVFPSGQNPGSSSSLTPLGSSSSHLSVPKESTVNFTADNSYFYDNGTIDKDSAVTVTGTGTVRLHFAGNLTIAKNIQLNSGGDPEDLVIYVAGNFTVAKEAQVKAIVYAGGNIEFDKDSSITGALTAGGNIILGKNTSVSFDSGAIGSANFNGMCSGSGGADPVAVDDSAVVTNSGSVTVNVASNDTDDSALDLTSISIIAGPANGSVSVNANGTVNYTHNGGSATSDSFTYQIDDDTGNTSNTATVSVTIITPADCSVIFPGGIQTHGVDGIIRVHAKGSYSAAKVLNSGTILSTVRIADHDDTSDPGSLLCGSSSPFCTATGSPATSNSIGIPANTSSVDVSSSGTLGSGGNNNYRDISIANNGSLVFSGNYSEYFVRELTVGDDAALTLAPGTYWIEDFLKIGKRSTLSISPVGTVQIFVGDKVEFKDYSQINMSGSASQLLVYSNSSGGEKLKLKKGVDARGYFYTQGELEFKEESTLTGALSGYGINHIDNGSTITYELETVDFPFFCQSTASSAVDHYAIGYSSNPAVTCEAVTVTITAHDSSDAAVEPGDSVTISLNTGTGQGDWAAGSGAGGSFSNGTANDGIASYSWAGGESSVSLLLTHTAATTAPHMDIDISDGDGKTDKDGDSSEDANLQFADAAFKFGTIANQIAGKASSNLQLQAIRTDTDTGACEAGMTSSHAVQMAYQCQNPSTCIGDNKVTIDGGAATTIRANPASAVSSYQPVTLDFGSNGTATFTLNYTDAGQIRLHASADTVASGDDPAVTLTGASENFVVRPFGFYVDIPGNPAATSASGDKFKKAGESFTTTLRAVVWEAADDDGSSGETAGDGIPDSNADLVSNSATPNFGRETSPESATITHSLVLPTGGEIPSLSGSSFSSFSSGEKSNSMSWSEVGILGFSAALDDGDYLGSGQNVTGAVSHVGRFYPDRFELSAGTLTNRSDLSGCSAAFTYMDETFNIAYTLTAVSVSGSTTRNYAGAFALLDSYGELTIGATDSNINLTTRLSAGVAPVWPAVGASDAGISSISQDLTFSRSPGSVDGPYNSLMMASAPLDDDGVRLADADFDVDIDGDFSYDSKQLGATASIRFGRLVISNAFGPETEALNMVARTEYWNGGAFVVNDADSCTTLSINTDPAGSSGHNGIAVGGGTSDLSFNGSGNTTAASGDFGLSFSAPGAGNTGEVQVRLYTGATPSAGISSIPWLLYDWDADGSHDDDPGSRTATFGRYRGHDRVIYWQETFSD